MSKLIISRPDDDPNNFVPVRKVTYETSIKPELLFGHLLSSDTVEDIVNLMTEEFTTVIKEGIRQLLLHKDKQIIVDHKVLLAAKPVITEQGAALTFDRDEETIVTIRGNEKC